jgi:hypothetical protein
MTEASKEINILGGIHQKYRAFPRTKQALYLDPEPKQLNTPVQREILFENPDPDPDPIGRS